MLKTILSGGLLFALGMALPPVVYAEPLNDAAVPRVGSPLSGGVTREVLGMGEEITQGEHRVKASPNDAEAHFLLALAYSRTPYLERALEELDLSRRIARKSPEGFALFDRKIAEYEKRIDAQSPDPVLMYRLGFAYYVRGYAVEKGYIVEKNDNKAVSNAVVPNQFYDKAEEAFRHLIRLDPDDFWARNYLGYLLAERNPQANHQAAVQLWRESLAISEDNPGAYMLLGQAAMQEGDLRQAVLYTSKALHSRNQWLKARGINPEGIKIRL
ncbi:tetratricopeptide repeat protein [Vampirovibrio chlorellavorus]|uniref:tetratricopeptide repeat protein n=1 Tax=Vampirovibrio chlorellavorus TaxID=758823 RepID=UPI0026EC2BCA|nr:tetratricopeptide repeat protein [Vampirovibrio chlorellavorus]